eukprot:5680632-Lingulodinium_polyedra.AAC.1
MALSAGARAPVQTYRQKAKTRPNSNQQTEPCANHGQHVCSAWQPRTSQGVTPGRATAPAFKYGPANTFQPTRLREANITPAHEIHARWRAGQRT